MINQKKFGVWMDTQQATIVSSDNQASDSLVIIAHINGEVVTHNTSEKNEHNDKRTLQLKFFKEISSHLQNATHLHATGTGQIQEQFIHYLAATAQFKNLKTEESTANKMSDKKLVEFFSAKLN